LTALSSAVKTTPQPAHLENRPLPTERFWALVD
jgi:hypothetical protein